jgi:hypothetical protein
MHNSNIMYTDPFPDRDQPNKGAPESFNFNHNGDFSGDVWLDLEGWRVEKIHDEGSPYARHGQPIYNIRIPFPVLAELVAEAVRDRRVSDYENMGYERLLGL